MGDVIPNSRFVKKTPAQRDRLRRKFAQRTPGHAASRRTTAKTARKTPRRS